MIAGWVYRSVTGQGYDFYVGMLDEYGLASGVAVVFALMVVSSVVSMAIRQLRHLAAGMHSARPPPHSPKRPTTFRR